MKKHTTAKKKHQALTKVTKTKKKQVVEMAASQRLTIGLDLGDRTSRYCILNEAGEVVSEGQLLTTQTGLNALFEKMPSSRVALEVGTHSPWVSRQIGGLGHEVIVANPHKVKRITQSVRQNDRIDAQKLARLARVDPQLLAPIRHRGAEAPADLAVIRARAELVAARTGLINCARGLAKPMGERLQKCAADQVEEALAQPLSAAAQVVIGPLLKSVEAIREQMGVYDRKIEEIAQRYPEAELLTQVYGVGTLIALTYILTIEDAQRFPHSRDVGAFLGIQPQAAGQRRQPARAGDQQNRRSFVAELFGAGSALQLAEGSAG
jgi:transposase